MPSVKLNIALLKNNCNFNDPETFIVGYDQNRRHQIEGIENGFAFVSIGHQSQADWVRKFPQKIGGLDISTIMPRNTSHGLNLFFNVQNRIMVLNWGAKARYAIKKDAVEEEFGIYVANKLFLDSEDARLKASQSRVNEANPTNKIRHFGSAIDREIAYYELDDLETFKELSVTLAGEQALDISKLIGKYSSLNVAISFEEHELPCIASLPDKLSGLLDIYNSVTDEDIGRLFKGMQPVRDATLIATLDNRLVNIVAEVNSPLYLYEPDVDFDFSGVASTLFKLDRINHRDMEFRMSDYLAVRPNPTLDDLKQDEVHLLDDDGNSVKEWKVYKCIYGDVENAGEQYVFSEGKWYNVVREKYQRICNAIDAATEHMPIDVNVINQTRTEIQRQRALGISPVPKERIFNGFLCDNLNGEFFDQVRKQIRVYEDKFEVCDIYLPATKEFIHAKFNYNASALGHMFNQGYVSANTFAIETVEFCNQVNRHIANVRNQIPNDKAGAVIRYLILDKSNHRRLTFFSKIVLKSKIDDLSAKGFSVKLSWVSNPYQ